MRKKKNKAHAKKNVELLPKTNENKNHEKTEVNYEDATGRNDPTNRTIDIYGRGKHELHEP